MHRVGSFDWNDLRYFLAVAREGSTLAAARVLRVNQSTVHRRLTALESCLGAALAERHPAGYRLTELGRQIKSRAEAVEEAVSALRRHVESSDKGMKGSIRLTCSTGVAHLLLTAKLLDRFHARHPGLKVELLMAESMFDLSKGEADIAIRGGQPKDEALVGRKIADVPWGIYASRSYVQQFGCPRQPADLDRHRIVDFVGDIADLKAAHWMRTKAPGAAVVGRSGSVPSVLLAVKSGVGLAPLPAPLADRDRELVCALGPISELSYPMYLLTHRDLRKTPRISAFFDFCAGELGPVLTGREKRQRA